MEADGWRRFFVGSAADVEIDSAFRVLVPPELRVMAGLDKDVLLIATGEFGRTPKINTQTGTQTKVSQPGRDHWPNAMSMLVSGGGMRTGQIIGATNAKGEYPVERVMSPNNLWATVYKHLGIDYNDAIPDFQGRPNPILPFGDPIPEIMPSGVA